MRFATLFDTLLLVGACGCPAKPSEPTQSQPGSAAAQPTPTTPPATVPTTPPTAPPTTTPPATTPPPGPGSGTGSGSGPAPSWAGPGIGENCGDGDKCAKGLTCVSYYGIAGARGPQFKTCEIKCTADAQCPSGTKCVTVADGPGQVCRK